jgi:hypothetical protein
MTEISRARTIALAVTVGLGNLPIFYRP